MIFAGGINESAKNLFSLIIKTNAFRMPLDTKHKTVGVDTLDCFDYSILCIRHGLQAFADVIESGPGSPEAQTQAAAWHQHIGNFYTCSLEMLRGLGNLYVDSPDFTANFRKVHPDLPEFVRDAINIYVKAEA